MFPSPFISAEQFHQTAIVLVQRFQDQSRSQTEAQDKILQSQCAADLVLRVDEPQQQTVSFALQQFGELLLVFLGLLRRFHQGCAGTDLAVVWRDVPVYNEDEIDADELERALTKLYHIN